MEYGVFFNLLLDSYPKRRDSMWLCCSIMVLLIGGISMDGKSENGCHSEDMKCCLNGSKKCCLCDRCNKNVLDGCKCCCFNKCKECSLKKCKDGSSNESDEEYSEECEELWCNSLNYTRFWMENLNNQLNTTDLDTVIKYLNDLEGILENTVFNEKTTSIIVGRLVAQLFRVTENFSGLTISANNDMVTSNGVPMNNSIVEVNLPKELTPAMNATIVFCMITSPEQYNNLGVLDGRLIGLSLSNQTVSGLSEMVNISIPLDLNTVEGQAEKQPSCQYLNFSTHMFYQDGCTTDWQKDKGIVVCSCNHLTYFAVLMVSPAISKIDETVLNYITVIGCSLSLFFLVVTVIMYATQRNAGTDVSQKVHINLAVALILLNIHFLPSQWVAGLPSLGPCIYFAVLLHYSLLATFTWTAIEGFHLYMLLVRVFNLYVRRYMLKLSLVGWGFPAVVVILIATIDKNQYNRVTLHTLETNGTVSNMCYISSDVVKLVTTVGLFVLIFLFNLGMLVLTVRRVLSLRPSGEKGRAGRNIFTVLGITCLLGLTWGIIFFSFGQLTKPGLYLFCVLNSLQGVFLFLWFCVFKCKDEDSQPSNHTQSTNT
ncbi:hypothetical protein UPYG_G00081400 [Umbra pygmaea]|uniref:Adhesion G-protein coupled receptor G5-like n=1 Tax=Umbra pygmaea TaxID=75934 RepID=A0ABD0XDS2_UMBPY